MPERRFLPWFYDLGVKTHDSTEDETEPEVGNQAYRDYMTRVIEATGRKIDWTQVSLAVVLDRDIRADEADALAKPPMRVSIEDTGPILEAIGRHALGAEVWDEIWDAADRAQQKQSFLDLILPGLTVFIDQVNAQLADQEQPR